MGLQVWLTLNNNILDQGVAGATFTGTPTYGDGKLGKCLTNGTITSTNTTVPITVSTNPKYSICSWVKTTSTNVWVWRMGDNTGGCRGLWMGTGNAGPHFAYGGSGAFTGNVAINNGVWHHVCFTVNGATSSAYVDGVYCGGSTSTKTDPVANNHIYLLATSTCALQDFRIYDHCLSPREVKELSKGLVCHFKLDGPVSNLVPNSAPLDLTGWSAAGTSWANTLVDCSIAPFGKAIRSTYTGSGGNTGGMHHQPQDYTKLVNGATYTLSAWIRASKNCHVAFYNEYMSTTGSTQITTEWKKYSWTSKIDTSRSYHSNICYTNTTSEITTNMWIEVFGFKLEQSSHSTPWTPNTSDAAYAAMGYNDGVEPDVSGNSYNATKMGTFSSVADTARYSSCYVFSGSNYIKMDPSLYQTMRLARDEVTVSIWAYRDNWKDYATSGSSTQWDTMFSCQQAGGFTIYETTLGSFTFVIGTGSSSNTYKTAGVGNAYAGNLSAGWHHFALTYNGLDLKGYIDGNLVKTTNCYTTKTQIWYYTGATTVFIGAEASSGTGAPVGGYYWRGRLSDFRVYETALSDTDIKELYNTPVSIANNGAMLVAGEIVEV